MTKFGTILILLLLLTATPSQAVASDLLGLSNTGAAVKAQIVADTSTSSDKPFAIAITLTTNPDWHIYWSNPGDAGLPTTFHWNLPPGYRIEPAPLPVPSAFVQPGNLTIYGYTGKTTFVFKIIPAPQEATGAFIPSPATFAVTANWLCCNKDQCVPGQAKLDLQLPPAGIPTARVAAPADQSLFNAARQNLPSREAPKDVTVAQATVVDDSHNATATLDLAFKIKPLSVEAYPDADEGLAVTSVKIDQTEGHAKISLAAHRMGGQGLEFVYLPLLVVYTLPDPGKNGGHLRRGFFVPVDLTKLGDAPR